MAGEAVVGALRVVLGMDTASYEDGAKRAAKHTEGFGDAVKAVFGGVTLSRIVERTFDAITHTIKEGVTQAFEFADQMGKMAQKVGISVETLSGLKVAADLSDVSMETLSTGLGRLSKAIVETAHGTGEAKKYFEALGISVTDSSGNLKGVNDVLVEISNKFEHSSDGAGKVAAAMAFLGKTGKELIPLLNEGGASLKEMMDVAEKMGLVISQNTANQTQKFNDDIKILRFSMQGIANLVLADLIPGFVRVGDAMANTAKTGDAIRATAKFIVDGFKKVVEWTLIVIDADQLLGAAFQATVKGIGLYVDGLIELFNKAIEPIKTAFVAIVEAITKPFKAVGDFFIDVGKSIVDRVGQAIEYVTSKMPEASKETNAVTEAFQKWRDSLTSDKFEEASKAFDKMSEAIDRLRYLSPAAAAIVEDLFKKTEEGGKKTKAALDIPVDKLTEELNKLAVQARVVGGDFSSLPAGFAELAVRLELTDKKAASLGYTFDQLTPKQQQLAAAMDLITAKQIAFEAITPFEKYQLAMDNLVRLGPIFEKLGLDQDALTQKMIQAGAAMASAYGEAAKSIVSPMASAFKDLASMNKQYAGAAKAAAIAEATVNTYLAATKALASGFPPFNYIAAAAVTAAGLANIAKISQQQFAQGGTFKVGGVGGIDSQLVQFQATPGEMVDVRKPGQDRGTATEVTVNLRGRELLNKDMVRDLFSALNDGVRDGYRLKLAEA